jgi:hypothetical protein
MEGLWLPMWESVVLGRDMLGGLRTLVSVSVRGN